MMTERGVVTAHEGGLARVEIPRSAHCAMCSSKEICGKGDDAGPMVLMVDDPLGVPVGASVEIGVPDKAVLKGALLVYGMPVAVLIAALAAAEIAGLAQVVGVVAGVAGGGIALFIGGRISRRGALRPRLLRVVTPPVS